MYDPKAFVERMANPHAWLMSASNLHDQAAELYARRRQSGTLTRSTAQGEVTTWEGVNKSVFLLGGFALENAIKAFLVYENPEWISNGKLSSKLRSHSLTKLQSMSELIPFKRRMRWVLTGFEAGLESWARYPCALTSEDSVDEPHLYLTLWDGYLRVMAGYGARLQRLLSGKLWHGPHGFAGRWEFQGEFLGATIKSLPSRKSH